jgi:anti-sigma regulatory factor (Ser/Thr protein kinase)
MVARRLLAERFGTALEPDQLHTAKLLSSELVNNAVLHGRGEIRLQADLNGDRLLVEVIDDGEGFAHKPREFDFGARPGRGLDIVNDAASRWGIGQGTTYVWFELTRQRPRLGRQRDPLS